MAPKQPAPRPQPRQRTPDRHRAHSAPTSRPEWRAIEVAAVLAIVAASIATTMAVLSSPLAESLPSVGRIGVRTIVIFSFYGVQVVLLAFFAHRRRIDFSVLFRLPASFDRARLVRRVFGFGGGELEFRERSRVWASAVAWVVGLLVLLRMGGVFWRLVTEGIGWMPPSGELADLFGRSTFGLVLAVVTVVVAGPFVEELVYRVVVQGWLRRRLAEPVAIGMTAVLFALSHLSWWALVPNIALGIATGMLASRRATIWPSVALHALHNGTLVAAAFMYAG